MESMMMKTVNKRKKYFEIFIFIYNSFSLKQIMSSYDTVQKSKLKLKGDKKKSKK